MLPEAVRLITESARPRHRTHRRPARGPPTTRCYRFPAPAAEPERPNEPEGAAVSPEGDTEDERPGSSGTPVAARLRVGITTPVLTMLPDAHAHWEQEGTIDDVVTVAEAADRLGFYHLTCSEHVIIPTDVAAARGSRYWDPLATLGYLAAFTSRIRLATNVLVLGYHHPLEIAKRYGTLDQVCKGRLVLGLGVGSLQEEFELLGAPFTDRGPRADEAIAALRVSLSEARPRFEGRYYQYGDVVLDPCARQASVPIWIGGRTARSLRRAVELADGWVPFGIRAADIGVMLAQARDTEAWAVRRVPLEVVLQNGRPADPVGDPDGTRRMVGRLVEAGATGLQLRFVHHSLAHYLEQLEALADLVGTEQM
jgi:probable F420-dependent oxidoreductase